jgi:DnaJ-class molecular chaperone
MRRVYRQARSRTIAAIRDAVARTPERAYRGPMADDDDTCPRCDGEGLVATRGASVMVDQGDDPPMGPCPVCRGKGTVAPEAKPT